MTKMNRSTKTITAFCRACHTRIHFERMPELFDIVICPECEEEFEVVSQAPLQLDWPSDAFIDDDWDDDQYGDEDFNDSWD